MVKIVSFISQKGGVGKSTLARALAREASYAKLLVKIIDLDFQQGTCVDWHRERLRNKKDPPVFVEAFSSAKEALKHTNNYDLVILDGPARTSQGTLEIAKNSDLIIQPTGPSVDDLRPAVKEFHALVKNDIKKTKLFFVFNHISTETEYCDAKNYIEEAGYKSLDGYLPERVAYRNAQNRGGSITEVPYQGLSKKADQIIQEIVNFV